MGGIKATPHQHPQANYSTQNCAKYDSLKDTMWGSSEEALAVVRDANWWALAATVLLEDKIRDVKPLS